MYKYMCICESISNEWAQKECRKSGPDHTLSRLEGKNVRVKHEKKSEEPIPFLSHPPIQNTQPPKLLHRFPVDSVKCVSGP